MTAPAKIDRRHPKRPEPSRYYDQLRKVNVIKVLPGDYQLARKPNEMLVTTLGSCVSACIRNPFTGFGGMNHFMLPEGKAGGSWSAVSDSLRYGNHAMEVLINAVLRSGCLREDLEIKVFGGGNVIRGKTQIGTSNADFVLSYLKDEGLTVAAQDLGGLNGRRIHYMPSTGKVNRLNLRRATDSEDISQQERRYRSKILQKRPAPDDDDGIELFGDTD